MTDKSIYYNPNRMLSYDRILNFIIGARGIGKSFAMKRYPVNRFLKHGEQFIYLRRFKDELKKVPNYFNDLKEFFPNEKLEVKGKVFYINDKIAGWAIPLSSWQSEKSTAYPKVTTIIYDEFIREKDNSGYIPNEVNALLNFMDTVFRMRDNVRCICLSNAVSVVNPYFLYFELTPNINKEYNAYESILIQIPDSSDFSNHKRKTKLGKLIDPYQYGRMSIDNQFTDDTDVFIHKRSQRSKHMFSIIYKKVKYGIWVDVECNLMFISKKFDPSNVTYSIDIDDFDTQSKYMKDWRSSYHLKKMVKAFKDGKVRFEDIQTKKLSYEMFNSMNIF